MQNEQRTKVYAWEFPVRLTHWINVLSIVTLSVTGFLVGKPLIHAISSQEYIMGWIRFIHFVAAYAFAVSVLLRIYWSFAGNRHANMLRWIPLTGQKIADIINDIKCYLFINTKSACSIGHTSLAALTYLILFLLFLFQISSGFALYSVTHHGALWTILGGWLLGILDLQTARVYHHLFMYIVIAFAIVHVYMSWSSDIKEKSGVMSSMFSGWKFMTERDLK